MGPAGSSVRQQRHKRRLKLGAFSVVVASLAAGSSTVVLAQTATKDQGRWAKTASPSTHRIGFTATLLGDGKVLVAGGRQGLDDGAAPIDYAEVYDPSTRRWARTGAMNTPRSAHTATLLKDGKVLVAGGVGSGRVVATSELYDPKSGKWAKTGSLATPRQQHKATLLEDGNVLVTGGAGAEERRKIRAGEIVEGLTVREAELFRPATGKWAAAGSLPTGRLLHTATLLESGKVLVVGGFSDKADYAESGGSYGPAVLYDPGRRRSSLARKTGGRRGQHTATLMETGEVLVAGGLVAAGSSSVAAEYSGLTAAVEVYEPTADTWGVTGPLPHGMAAPQAVALQNGDVLLFGFQSLGGIPPRHETRVYAYDPDARTWAPGSAAGPRLEAGYTVTLLQSDRVLVVDGRTKSAYFYTAATSDEGRGQAPLVGAALVAIALLAVVIGLRRRRMRRSRGQRRSTALGGGFTQ